MNPKDERLALVRSLIRDVPDFPKPGIVFKDITPLVADARGLAAAVDLLAERYASSGIDAIAAAESRGFLFGAPLALRLGCGLALLRKPGKLPWKTARVTYQLEYGEDALEMHVDAVPRGARVLLIDDLLATGGTAEAAARLVRAQGGEVAEAAFVIELGFLDGRARLAPTPVFSLIGY